jgi:Mrp family chromosome partitioning ATPase
MESISESVERNHSIPESLSLIQHKYLVTSNKRRVGKTCLAANLAVTLSKRGVKVGLMDLDYDGTDISRLLGLKGFHKIGEDDLYMPQGYSNNLQVISIESIIRNMYQTAMRRENFLVSAINQCITNVKWGPMDYLIVDSPPGTGPESLAVAKTIRDGKIIFVSTPQRESLIEIGKLVRLYASLEMTILGVIENISGFFCTDCDKTGKTTVTESIILDIDYLGRIPNAVHMAECIRAGEFYLEKYPNSEAAHGYKIIIEKIIENRR